jgi:poly(hydroxyalkanoate) depolymerase family esterase
MAKTGWITGNARASGGSRDYKLWVPTTLQKEKPAPLLMLLHGCTHGAEDTAEISGMNEVAEANQFLVVYPEQSRLANLMKCWNWFDPKHHSRDAGEPSILAAIVEQVSSLYNVDPDRVYVAGVSAGGAMAVIAGATYPDLFAAIAVVAGGEFAAATSVSSGFGVLKHGGPDPVQQGLSAFETMKNGLARRSRRRMPVIVFHGTADARVNPVNAEQVIAQWSKTNACLAAQQGESGFALSEKVIAGQVPEGYAYRRHIYTDQAGRLLMEKWIVEGLDHAWPGSPTPHKYGDPKGPRASAEIWRFFCEAGSSVMPSTAPPEFSPKSSRETIA